MEETTIFTTHVITIAVAIIGLIGVTLSSWIGANSHKVKIAVQSQGDDIVEIKSNLSSIENKVNKHNTVVESVLLSNGISSEIDDIAKRAYEYISHDPILMAYVDHKVQVTREFIKDMVESKFNLTCNEVKAKFENYRNTVSSLDNSLPPSLIGILKVNRAKLEKDYLSEIIKIVSDNITNSKYSRFKNATVYFIDKEIVTFVKTFIKNK